MSSAQVARSWSRIEAWLGEHAAVTLGTLNPPADPGALAEAERVMGFGLPADLVASLARHDGAGADQGTPGRFELPGGFGLMPLAEIVREWRMLTGLLAEEFDDESMVGSWWHPRWVPVGQHNAPDRLIIDQRPGKRRGQAGEFRHDGEAGLGMWDSFGALLAHTADLLEGRVTDDQAVPRTASGRLIWGWEEKPRSANPRSLLALADEAAEQATPPETPPVAGAELSDGPDWILGRGRCCLTFARGITEAELISRLGGDPERAVARTVGQTAAFEASWRSGYRPIVAAGRVGEWAFCFEKGHEEGMRDEALRRLSAGTRAISVAFDGIITRLGYAEDGGVVGRFNSRQPGRANDVADPGWSRRLEQAGLLPPDPERYVEDEAVAAAGLAVSLGPGSFDPRVLREPLRGAPLLPLLADPPAGPRRLPVQADPELVAAIEYATEDQLRPAVAALARRQVSDTGLSGYPEIVAAVERAARRPTGQIPDDTPLGVLLRTLHAEWHAALGAFSDRADPEAAGLLTESERAAWGGRSHLAEVIEALVARPAAVAAYLLTGSPETFSGREEFLGDLAQVSVPPDATERLERAEQAERDAAPSTPWIPPRSRRLAL